MNRWNSLSCCFCRFPRRWWRRGWGSGACGGRPVWGGVQCVGGLSREAPWPLLRVAAPAARVAAGGGAVPAAGPAQGGGGVSSGGGDAVPTLAPAHGHGEWLKAACVPLDWCNWFSDAMTRLMELFFSEYCYWTFETYYKGNLLQHPLLTSIPFAPDKLILPIKLPIFKFN